LLRNKTKESLDLTKTRVIKWQRIAGVDIQTEKEGLICSTYIFGVGNSRAKENISKGPSLVRIQSV